MSAWTYAAAFAAGVTFSATFTRPGHLRRVYHAWVCAVHPSTLISDSMPCPKCGRLTKQISLVPYRPRRRRKAERPQ